MGRFQPWASESKIGARRGNPPRLFFWRRSGPALAGRPWKRPRPREGETMLYAILAYHVEADLASWTPEADAALMTELHKVHDRLKQDGKLGPAPRIEGTGKARTLRGPGNGTVIDGPFAETKE